jgi:hypothetical protein
LAPGQTIQIQLGRYKLGKRSDPSQADGFLIHRVDIEDVGGQYLRYTVECVGSEKTSWEDTWRKLAQQERVQRAQGDSPVHLLRRLDGLNDVIDTVALDTDDGIPWVASARVGFSEVVAGVDTVQTFVSPGMWAEYYIAR